MKHTECEDCELSNGDCGYHFKMDGVTNYDIASLSACDQYGNCMFFKSKAKLQGDLISREALKKAFNEELSAGTGELLYTSTIMEIIDNAPTVPLPNFKDGYKQAILDGKTNFSRPQGEWILCEDTYFSKCSICGDIWLNEECGNYCSNCGASMRKGGKE